MHECFRLKVVFFCNIWLAAHFSLVKTKSFLPFSPLHPPLSTLSSVPKGYTIGLST